MATAQSDAATKEANGGFEDAKFDLREVPINEVRLSKYALRDVDRNSEDYLRLRDAIAATNGPYLPILVRVIPDPEHKGKTAFGLIDGLQRFSCCQDLGFAKIPARVIEMEDAELAMAQIIANRSRIETKPGEYTKQLQRMLNANPTMTLDELSEQLHCSVKWLRDRLSLAQLHEKVTALVDEGKIPLAQAFQLAKLRPADEQLQFVEQAQTQGIQEFSGHIQNRIKDLRNASRQGRDPGNKASFTPVPHMRAVKEIKGQFDSPTLANTLCDKVNARTPEEGFRAAIMWVLSMDPDTVEVLRQADADRKAKDEADKEKKKKERIAKRAAAAAAAARAAGIEPGSVTAEEDDEDDDDQE